MTTKAKILAVDDEEFNIDILEDYLTDAGYDVVTAENGRIAVEKLAQHPDVALILLDRMMPEMNGMEVMAYLKADARYKDIPVIMQTAAASSQQVMEGIQAGIYYYLTKPYEEEIMLSIVKAALDDARSKNELVEQVRTHRPVLGLLEHAVFTFRTLEEARNLAYFLSACFPKPDMAVYGLNELLTNAVEHGNLGITYDEKTELVRAGTLNDEIERRLLLPENLNKQGKLQFEADSNAIRVRISDEGNGFDWKDYMDVEPYRATDPNGRGIAISRMMSFSSLDYIGKGNEVVATVLLGG